MGDDTPRSPEVWADALAAHLLDCVHGASLVMRADHGSTFTVSREYIQGWLTPLVQQIKAEAWEECADAFHAADKEDHGSSGGEYPINPYLPDPDAA